MNKKNQIITIILVLIVAFVVFVYFKNSSNNGDSGSTVVVDQKNVEFEGAREILGILKRMAKVEIKDTLFKSDVFNSLQDTTVPLISQPIIRNDPFAPIGKDGIRSTSTSPFSTTTRTGTTSSNRI